jgi:hypothetical protein
LKWIEHRLLAFTANLPQRLIAAAGVMTVTLTCLQHDVSV